ncbi:MAG: TraR/DksA family transcriptional regulator [Bacteriovoracaceae bacterium]|nr:TraR/DksA family transcriptional regulator [Bacteriovoracaceae bacterium]
MKESGLTKKFIEEQKQKLLRMKTQLLNSMRDAVKEEITDADKTISEEGDLAQVLASQNLAIQVQENTLKKLRQIDLALHKMDMGTYGICEETGEPIELKRLERIPWARISIAAAEELERDNKKFHRVS